MSSRIPAPHMPVFNPEVYFCRRAAHPFTLDGNLEKAFWESAAWTKDFVDIEGDIRPRPRFQTRVKMLWDDNSIYFGAELWGDEIWANVTQRDDVIFRDNDFEIFIDPDSDTQCYCEFEMNARNTVWDLLLTKAYRDGGKPVNSFDIKGLESAVKIHGDLNNPYGSNTRWTCEVAMPFTSLLECVGQGKDTPKPGDFWRVNFSRVQWTVDIIDGQYIKRTDLLSGAPLPEDNWVWSPMGIVNMHYPELWGFVFFCREDENYAIPEDERLKWDMRCLYYAQHAHYDQYGCFTVQLPSLREGFTPKVQITDNSFEITCPSSDGTRELVLLADGKIMSFSGKDKR